MNDWGSENDDRLLVAAAVDPGAFAEFYGRYERAMLAFFVHRIREPGLAADLTAEVFAADSIKWRAANGTVIRTIHPSS
jgi:hypothetical protein